MGILDIILLLFGVAAGVGAYTSGSDVLYKLFLGLTIGFLLFIVGSTQVELIQLKNISSLDSYELFLNNNYILVLSFLLYFVPIVGLIFALNKRLIIVTRKKSISQLLLGLLLPIFLIGMISYLATNSILNSSAMWQRVFGFLSQSLIYETFIKLPWGIYIIVLFIIFYKTIFLLIGAFASWVYNEVILAFIKNWNERKKQKEAGESEIEE